MKRLLTISAATILLVGLAGCSFAPKTYASTSQLRKAYTAAGEKCSKPSDVPGELVSEGAHAILCPPGVNLLLVFDTKADKNAYLAKAITDDFDQQAIGGDRWVVTGSNVEKLAGSMGGSVIAK